MTLRYQQGAVALLLTALCWSTTAHAAFFADGRWLLDLRLRYEGVDDAAFAQQAQALTARTRIGWRSGAIAGWHVLVEAEDVRAVIEDYNSTANGRVQRPVVVDPKGTEWNQAYIGWNDGDRHQLAIGRQRLSFDNQRHIGNVGWRQNEQTFDALSYRWRINPRWHLRYAWLDKAHRVFGNSHPNRQQAEHRLDAHLFNAAWNAEAGTLVGYGYFIDNRDLPSTSTRSLGLRFTGKRGTGDDREWFYELEFARQLGWRRGADTGSAGYRQAETGLRVSGHAARLGVEILGSNGSRAFQTPLATGHAFNGWADRFLATPLAGLQDRYVKLDGPLGPLRYLAAWHDFRPDRGGARYGREFDVQLAWPFASGWNAIAKFADYRADAFSSDVRKSWLSIEYRY